MAVPNYNDSSYPPLCQTAPASVSNHFHLDHDLYPSLEIPLIDLHNLNIDCLVEACKNWGLFRLSNHNIPICLFEDINCCVKDLFHLPFETKQAKFKDHILYFWGTPALTQNVKNLNWLEGFHMTSSNVFPDGNEELDAKTDNFRYLAREYTSHMGRITRRIFTALALELGLDKSCYDTYLSNSDGMLRVYRYPPCPKIESGLFGMEAHTDSSVLTVLNHEYDEAGGFQVWRDNTWFNVCPMPGTLVVNLGDMMQVISNDEYKTVQHRVLANKTKERISVGYFSFPQEDAVLVGSHYRPFSYREFKAQVKEDNRVHGFKVGLPHFKVQRQSK